MVYVRLISANKALIWTGTRPSCYKVISKCTIWWIFLCL